MLIDTHAHLNFNAYKSDFDEVIKRALENDVWMINVGSQYTTSKRAVEIAEKYEKGVFAAIGLHPIHLETGLVKIKNDLEEVEVKIREEEFDYKNYKELAKSPKVVAIGEIGFDYYYRPKTKKKLQQFKEKQRTVLWQQLELAQELNLPVIFHCRMAHKDLIEVLKSKTELPFMEARGEKRTNFSSTIKNRVPHQDLVGDEGEEESDEDKSSSSSFAYRSENEVLFAHQKSKIEGVIHCFTGTWEEAQKYMDMGFYLGFNGLIFKLDFDEIIKKTPLDKILIETDCPYLTPPQAEGRNESLNMKYIAEKIAKIKNKSYEEIAIITTENAKRLFKI